MQVIELKSKIILNEIPNFLILTGEEFVVLRYFVENIIKKLKDFKVMKPESVKDVIPLCGKSFFNVKKLFIVTDDENFLKDEKNWDKVQHLLGDNKLILVYHNYDGRLGFWKHFDYVFFEYLESRILCNHLNKDFGLSLGNCQRLINLCGNDYSRCKLELDKVKNYAQYTKINLDDAFEKCADNVICVDYNFNIIDFVDYVLQKDFKMALKILKLLKDEPSLKILSFIYNGFKGMLIAQTIYNAKNIQQNTGLSYVLYKKYRSMVGAYSDSEIEMILLNIMHIEQNIKKGILDEKIAIDYFLNFLL